MQTFLTVFELFRKVQFRGRPHSSLMGSFIEKMKNAYCLEHNFKQFLLYNDFQNISSFQVIRVQK